MKLLYLECSMGAAGDMLAAALWELLPDKESFCKKLNQLGIPGVVFKAETVWKCGIMGTHMSVIIDGQEEEINNYEHHCSHTHNSSGEHKHDSKNGNIHQHYNMQDIRHIVMGHLHASDKVKTHIMEVYEKLAEAETHVHGVPVTELHFHEVGAIDAIADIAAVCMLMEELAPDRVIVSPVHVGSGSVQCAHGILLVPAPATAYILRNVPIYSGKIEGELCTPTGAALLVHFATYFGELPMMWVQHIGYGMGKKDFVSANCIRAMMGRSFSKQRFL